ncbi:hypothetical protein GX51_06291 [Blastomyces parvus]|uniref:Uncharacterized protein n=1 Tax=Blastomyces parvus TaxID=2060905 RepID=A0A2B7WSM1_9EURO|nr:hypothetical protein GX51_06291 [Blastomyces parvus]
MAYYYCSVFEIMPSGTSPNRSHDWAAQPSLAQVLKFPTAVSDLQPVDNLTLGPDPEPFLNSANSGEFPAMDGCTELSFAKRSVARTAQGSERQTLLPCAEGRS